MNEELLKNILGRLNPFSFKEYFRGNFVNTYSESNFKPLTYGNNELFRRISDNEPHSYENYVSYEAVYIFHHLLNFKTNDIDKTFLWNKGLQNQLEIVKSKYLNPANNLGELNVINLVTNLVGFDEEFYQSFLIPKFEKLLNNFDLNQHFCFGGFDSIFDLEKQHSIDYSTSFFEKWNDGLVISLSRDGISINDYSYEQNIQSGISKKGNIFEPVYVNKTSKRSICFEFEKLINNNNRESVLEEFLTTHYKEIFGEKYNQIQTQLWLKFPELDINSKKRRLDIFLRNSVINDWELFEIKRPIKLTTTYRDIPVMRSEVLHAIEQLKNYHKILQQDKVKYYFHKQGIDYYEPTLNLIVGNNPQISTEKWRWLISNHKEINILTYENLLREMQIRYNDRLTM
ncbi:DUF4263 domain-containing protein [Arenibacter sp. S6351L]|uniref:DUF4263 domain-containing protein n=1 Tax=Arenibacter sp. S6351L TaxID=2926407 RepID=UPI001FF2515C|nr:DUF4263 domain-containing protein [Arenibacter sp. S6351L]MCK0137356.1 DUF4263 domain-containing protein [Arenibacter sp. S6351L]